jgi:DNA-binding transcriptional regulator PaaX
MSDDKSNRGPADAKRINVKEDYEVRYWTKEFGISEDQLRAAVKRVGVMADDVRAELRRKH